MHQLARDPHPDVFPAHSWLCTDLKNLMLPFKIYILFPLKVYLLLPLSRWESLSQKRAVSPSANAPHPFLPQASRYSEVNLCSCKNALFKKKLLLKFLSHEANEATWEQWFSTLAAHKNCLELKHVLMARLHPRSNKSDTFWGGMQASEFYKFPQAIPTCSQIYNHGIGLALEPNREISWGLLSCRFLVSAPEGLILQSWGGALHF